MTHVVHLAIGQSIFGEDQDVKVWMPAVRAVRDLQSAYKACVTGDEGAEGILPSAEPCIGLQEISDKTQRLIFEAVGNGQKHVVNAPCTVQNEGNSMFEFFAFSFGNLGRADRAGPDVRTDHQTLVVSGIGVLPAVDPHTVPVRILHLHPMADAEAMLWPQKLAGSPL
jgi:hypothetical protein